jgi:hypothetical protein
VRLLVHPVLRHRYAAHPVGCTTAAHNAVSTGLVEYRLPGPCPACCMQQQLISSTCCPDHLPDGSLWPADTTCQGACAKRVILHSTQIYTRVVVYQSASVPGLTVFAVTAHNTTPRRIQQHRKIPGNTACSVQQLAWVRQQAYHAALGTMLATTAKARLLTLFLTAPHSPHIHKGMRTALQQLRRTARQAVKQLGPGMNAAPLHSCTYKGQRLAGAHPGAGICPKSLQPGLRRSWINRRCLHR